MRARPRGAPPPVRMVIVTLDAHLADAFESAKALLARDLPSLDLRLHVGAEWGTDPAAAQRCRDDLAQADLIVVTQLFPEEMAREIAAAVAARRDQCDAVFCALATTELVRCTRLGRFSMAEQDQGSPWSPVALLRRLRGERAQGRSTGERQMQTLRMLPKLLRFIPGTAQDVRAYFLALQYWLAGSDVNVANMVRLLVNRYAAGPREALRGTLTVGEPEEYPETGVYHPDLPGRHLAATADVLPRRGRAGVVGVLVGRSYVLAGNTAHYDAVIRALEGHGLAVIPAFAAGLDARPAIAAFFRDAQGRPRIDALVSLTGFSLVGGPAYNDAAAAQAVLAELDVPYLSLQTLEFQTRDEWEADPRGLNPLQATLQVAIPELDGATGPLVYGGKGRPAGGRSAAHSEPIPDRVALLARRVARLVRLRRTPRAERRLAIVLFNFPPNAGNTGSAAYLAVFPSLQRVLASLKEQGYTVDLPDGVEALRRRITEGNAGQLGAPANVHARIPVDDHVRREPYLAELERVWGPAPGRQLTDGGSLFVLGAQFGNVFVGVQPSFGWEGDPMRLLFEGSFAPTHAFSAFYRWLREDFGADAVLHFGTHGAVEFMPGKHVGLTARCWPERLIDDLPNVYLYASNNSSEGTLAKRRGAATLVSYLTPPVANAGLYRGLAELKGTLDRWRATAPDAAAERAVLRPLVQQQAAALELAAAEPAWTDAECAVRVDEVRQKLLELEYALIPLGLHTVGEGMGEEARAETLLAIAQCGRPELDLPALGAAIAAAAPAPPADADALARDAVLAVVRSGHARAGQALLERARAASRQTQALLDEVARLDALLRDDHEVPGLLRALDGRYVAPAPGGDLLRSPAVLPTGRNVYGFDPYRVPSPFALLEGRRRTELLLAKHREVTGTFPETVAMVLWGTDNMKTEGAPLAQVLALLGAVPRFDGVGRLAGARLLPLEQLGRPRVDVVLTLSGIFRDLLPLQVRLLAEAALLAASADEPEDRNFVRKHTRAHMAALGCDLETAALRVFSNAEGAYGSNVNLLIDTGQWTDEDELADQFVRRKSFAYGTGGHPTAQAALLQRVLGTADLAFQNLDSIELGATDIDQYVESLGGMQRVITRARGEAPPVYLGDHGGPAARVRTLTEQVELETRTRLLNPKWYEAQLKYGYEGVRNLSGHVTTTLGWSATARAVPGWVYTEVTRTFVLDPAMRDRLARLNANAAAAMAQRLLEANDRGYWRPDDATLDALRQASAELEDRLEGVTTA